MSRIAGPPTSSNGASSFHLMWDLPAVPLGEVVATLEVLEPPSVDRLYFWALQASFASAGERRGGAHLGLQHHPSYPTNGAANWGGYAETGGELSGSESALPSALNNVNTRTYPWRPNQPYQLRIYRSPDRGWRGSVTDLGSGAETVIRDLWVDAEYLTSPIVWSEVFADCDHPSVMVRWSDLHAFDLAGREHRVESVRVNYQTFEDGGCANTNSGVDEVGFVQRTAVERTQTAELDLPRSHP